MSEPRPPIEVRWIFRRIYTYSASLANFGLLAAVVSRLEDPAALKWLGLAMIGANVVLGALYLAGATVTDWAKLVAAARAARD
ncbi:hypothetical protein [Phenylobacterium sp.]|uniref:hypothetical protein n=1 Tax=Phenylobacterium sp. TaxID=1871053 RepID=UPI0025E36D77|nr:hypothetical protein [Phenylobacterium sp.]